MKKSIFTFLISALLLISAGCDKCRNISCENGGSCVNGLCDCPEKYTGPDCSDQKTPTKIKVTQVVLESFPATKNGASWDVTSPYPEVFFSLFKNQKMLYDHPTFIPEAEADKEYTFIMEYDFYFESVKEEYKISFYDDDAYEGKEYMGGIKFIPYEDNNGFPEYLELSDGISISCKLKVEYIF